MVEIAGEFTSGGVWRAAGGWNVSMLGQKEGLEAALAHPGPAIIDVLTDPLELVMPPKVTLEQAKGFSVWMMKAVLNGQGNELVQLALSAWER